MPVWHEALLQARRDDKIVLLGVIQEQHAERCRLFAQWQQFDWPILHDPMNRLGLTAVPVMVELDERGVTQAVNPSVEDVLSRLEANRGAAGEPGANGGAESPWTAERPDIDELRKTASRDNSYTAWVELGDGLLLWEGPAAATDAIKAYAKARAQQADSADTDSADTDSADTDSADLEFRLGVAYRMRHDAHESDVAADRPAAAEFNPLGNLGSATPRAVQQASNDFQLAVDHWTAALELNPNQYIYRRRIQQYGPRLTKPYPFYDWIRQARKDITARGEQPVALEVEPSGAEFAAPVTQLEIDRNAVPEPDPDGRIQRDTQGLVQAATTVVPASIRPGETVRVHVSFTPAANGHWNNENEPLAVWLNLPDGWQAERQRFQSSMPPAAESIETRVLEFEVQSPESFSESTVLRAYALYYACETTHGACLYLRQDLEIPVRVDAN